MNADVRIDSWAASLTDEQAWQLYQKSRHCPWSIAAQWAVEEFHLPEMPSRSAFYAWAKKMRTSAFEYRMEQIRIARAEAEAIARDAKFDEGDCVKAILQMATEETMRTGSAKEGLKFVQMAATITDRELKRQELSLKEKAQKTKEAALKLMREKFEAAERRLDAAAETVTNDTLSEAEKVEQIKEIFGIKTLQRT